MNAPMIPADSQTRMLIKSVADEIEGDVMRLQHRVRLICARAESETGDAAALLVLIEAFGSQLDQVGARFYQLRDAARPLVREVSA